MVNPVVIVPGYYGSKLVHAETGHLVWLNGSGLLHPKSTLQALRLDPADPDRVLAAGILDEVVILPPFIDPDIYKKLTSFLKKDLGMPAALVKSFSYDWRKSFVDAADELAAKIDQWLDETHASKVDVIAHSFGGLVTRAYLKKFGAQAKVDLFITCGAPHKGMLKTFEAVVSGRRVFTFPSGLVKSVSRGFPSAYELLPSAAADDLFTWNGGADNPFDQNGWCETQEMRTRLDAARQNLMDFVPPQTGVTTCMIYGTRIDTLTGAEGRPGGVSFTTCDDGDGTVPRVSARGDGVDGSGQTMRYPVPFGHHMSLFADAHVEKYLLTPLLRRDPLPAHIMVARFRHEPLVRPLTTNLLAVEVCDSLGQPVQADVRLDMPGTSISNRVVPRNPHRLDYVLGVRMPGAGQNRRYEVVAKIPGVAQPLRHEGRLFSSS